MKCPHCLENFHGSWNPMVMAGSNGVPGDGDGQWQPLSTTCPACNKVIIKLVQRRTDGTVNEQLVRPKAATRVPPPAEVPDEFAEDYREACLVLSDSPKASAALSRRCLQNLLRDHFGVEHGNLSAEIAEVLPKLPGHLADAVDAIRNVGNFAAHPMKSTHTLEVIAVEPEEAEWCLDVLESLFGFAFVQPALLEAKRDALNQKLAEAGKPPMKDAP